MSKDFYFRLIFSLIANQASLKRAPKTVRTPNLAFNIRRYRSPRNSKRTPAYLPFRYPSKFRLRNRGPRKKCPYESIFTPHPPIGGADGSYCRLGGRRTKVSIDRCRTRACTHTDRSERSRRHKSGTILANETVHLPGIVDRRRG